MGTNVLSNANNFHCSAIQYGCRAKPLYEVNCDTINNQSHSFGKFCLVNGKFYTTIILDTALLNFGTRANSFWHGPPDLHGKICSCFFNSLLAQSHKAIFFGGLFAFKQWISSSLKHDTVPRVSNLYCFCVKNPPKPYCIMGLCK